MTEIVEVEQPQLRPSVAKWKAYPAYKDSGIEWLGEIPAQWEVKRLKFFADVNMGQSPDSSSYNLDKMGFPFLQGNADFGEIHPDPKIWCDAVRKFAKPLDILLSVRAPVGELNISNQVYGIGRGLCAITVHNQVDRDYFWFLLQVTREGLLCISTGSTYEAVSVDEVKCQIGLVPSFTEQHSIAAFLNSKTSSINTLIAKKERLIELLQEKRAALISHAVTKGLDPDVKMKDSGVEWLGEIPTHWEVRRLKFCLTSIEQGWSPPCENRPAEIEEWGVLKVGCVNGINFNPDENKALPLELNPIPELEIKPGDVLISRANTRELLGT